MLYKLKRHDTIKTAINPCDAELFVSHLKLELLTQFPASNDEKSLYLWKIVICNIELFE